VAHTGSPPRNLSTRKKKRRRKKRKRKERERERERTEERRRKGEWDIVGKVRGRGMVARAGCAERKTGKSVSMCRQWW